MIIRNGVLGTLVFLLAVLSVNVSVGQPDVGRIKCVCIDAGHGGRDPGAVGSKVYEKNIVLSVVLKLGKMIEATYPDIKVVYIRDKDVYVELKERTRLANASKADLFISIHANAVENKKIKGMETFVLGSNNSEHNLRVAMKENSVIRYEDDYSVKYQGFDPSRAESYIMFNMLRSVHLEKSLTLASFIQKELVENTRHLDRDVRQAPLWVLKDVAMPAVLVEIGYITNAEEEQYMISANGQDKICKAVFKGFQDYKNKVEKKVIQPLAQAIEKVAEDENKELREKAPVEQNELRYAIQIASSVTKIDEYTKMYKEEEVYELNSDGRFRYYVAPRSELERVKECQKKVRLKIKDCFVIAIYKGTVISFSEARKLEQN